MKSGKVPRPIQLMNISTVSTVTEPWNHSSEAGASAISKVNTMSGGLRPIRSDHSAMTMAPTAGQKPTTAITLLQVRSS